MLMFVVKLLIHSCLNWFDGRSLLWMAWFAPQIHIVQIFLAKIWALFFCNTFLKSTARSAFFRRAPTPLLPERCSNFSNECSGVHFAQNFPKIFVKIAQRTTVRILTGRNFHYKCKISFSLKKPTFQCTQMCNDCTVVIGVSIEHSFERPTLLKNSQPLTQMYNSWGVRRTPVRPTLLNF